MTDLGGKVVVVTGGNSGIGKETVVELARMNAHVVIAARNPVKAAAAIDEVHERVGERASVETMPIDLASFDSVRGFVDTYTKAHDRCDVLVNNAGLVLMHRTTTVDGHESTFQINHLGPFLLTNLMHDTLQASRPARVVTVASDAHKMVKGLDLDDLDCAHHRYRGFKAYGASKLMNILFTRELAHRWDGEPITANCVHPGFVGSNFGKEGDLGWVGRVGMPLARPFAISNARGALTSIYLASSPDVDGVNGQYFYKGQAIAPKKTALDDNVAARLWDISAQMTGVS
jgi:NAD(P)-dependent dehydrogenase (short-subunit alcohol dehydrogenase family)